MQLLFPKLKNSFFLVFFLFAVVSVWAHPMPSTVIELSVSDQAISGLAKMPMSALADALKQEVKSLDQSFLQQYFRSHIHVNTGADQWQVAVSSVNFASDYYSGIGDYEEVVVSFTMQPSDRSHLRQFTFDYTAIIHEVVTHKILVFVSYDWENGRIQESIEPQALGFIAMDVRSGNRYPLEVDLAAGSWLQGTKAMFAYGMKHIREGLDHMLFLLTLLLVAPLAVQRHHWTDFQGWSYTLLRFLKISFAFTVGHSVTLLVGSFELFRFNAQYIEVLIAFSILLSAIHCIRPLFFKRETLVAASFGLIHGLAFSISLAGMTLGWKAKLLSILGFNLGIEAMQLIIMLLFFPVLVLSKWKVYNWIRIIFSVFTGIVAIAWIIERISGQDNFITAFAKGLL